MAIGNPFELEQTVSAGIISGMGRDLNTRNGGLRARFLQTDAAINPGNSGGPLVNLHGEVIGINTAIATNTGSYSGIGFAIPVNVAKWVTGQLIKRGNVERAYLGVEIRQLTPDLAAAFKAPAVSGALVTKVHPNTPAAEAGLKAGDIVTKFGDTEVRGPAELQQLVERVPIDSKQKIEVLRDAQPATLEVVAKPLPKDFALASRGGPLDRGELREPGSFEADKLGLEVGDLTAEKAQELGLKPNEGVLITAVDANSAAYEQGLRQGMVILKVDRKDVKSVEEFKAALKDGSLKDGILLYVRARNGNDFVLLKE
jgi:serine protease Do